MKIKIKNYSKKAYKFNIGDAIAPIRCYGVSQIINFVEYEQVDQTIICNIQNILNIGRDFIVGSDLIEMYLSTFINQNLYLLKCNNSSLYFLHPENDEMIAWSVL